MSFRKSFNLDWSAGKLKRQVPVFNYCYFLLNLSFNRRNPNDLEAFRNENKQKSSTYGAISAKERIKVTEQLKLGFPSYSKNN